MRRSGNHYVSFACISRTTSDPPVVCQSSLEAHSLLLLGQGKAGEERHYRNEWGQRVEKLVLVGRNEVFWAG